MAALRSPTVKKRRIARELMTQRKRAEMTLADAAKALGISSGQLSKIENRESTPKLMLVRAALALYGIIGEDAEALIDIARGAQQRGWWQSYTDVMPGWFGFYVGLEEEATGISTYESEIVPGLFQDEAYARAVFRLTAGEADIDRKVAARLRRQEVLHREAPAEVSAVLNETVLTRQVGGAKVMRGQLQHLIELAELPHVTIQVLPFAAGGHPAMTGPYVILGFPDAIDEPVVYLDNFTVGHVLEEPEHFTWYNRTHERLREMALSADDSLVLVQEKMRTIE